MLREKIEEIYRNIKNTSRRTIEMYGKLVLLTPAIIYTFIYNPPTVGKESIYRNAKHTPLYCYTSSSNLNPTLNNRSNSLQTREDNSSDNQYILEYLINKYKNNKNFWRSGKRNNILSLQPMREYILSDCLKGIAFREFKDTVEKLEELGYKLTLWTDLFYMKKIIQNNFLETIYKNPNLLHLLVNDKEKKIKRVYTLSEYTKMGITNSKVIDKLINEFNITYRIRSRYSRQFLEELVRNLHIQYNKDKPIALFYINSYEGFSLAFNNIYHPLSKIMEKYKLFLYQIDNEDDIIKIAQKVNEQYGKISLLGFIGHGKPTKIALGEVKGEKKEKAYLDISDYDIFVKIKHLIKRNADIVLFACSTGKGKDNLAKVISYFCKGCNVYAPLEDVVGSKETRREIFGYDPKTGKLTIHFYRVDEKKEVTGHFHNEYSTYGVILRILHNERFKLPREFMNTYIFTIIRRTLNINIPNKQFPINYTQE